MGKGIVEKLSKEYPLEVEWMGYELHPETPEEGLLVVEEFPEEDMKNMLISLNKTAAPLGIKFNRFEKIPNTKLALIASEFARDFGKYEEIHNRLFKAMFAENRDIGQLDTILSCAQEVGLEPFALENAIKKGSYLSRLEEIRKLAEKYEVVGLPTFIINDKEKIVGSQTYEKFVDIITGCQYNFINQKKKGSCDKDRCYF